MVKNRIVSALVLALILNVFLLVSGGGGGGEVGECAWDVACLQLH